MKRRKVADVIMDEFGMTLDEFYNSPEAIDCIVPACCECFAQVEPDGHCEHGNPSVLLALGVI
jgi:hypothetical protein